MTRDPHTDEPGPAPAQEAGSARTFDAPAGGTAAGEPTPVLGPRRLKPSPGLHGNPGIAGPDARGGPDAAGEGPPALVPDRGAHLGPFVLLQPLGEGGMGVVFSAYHVRLERKVALKFLRPELLASRGVAWREHLEREARAMARLSHPNVVAVHEVELDTAHPYIAMEYVAGPTLHAWLRARPAPRPWRPVLQRFLEAGRGLAAAHAKGLIHRDFKPDNVLLGEDGTARVTDFGLVQPVSDGKGAEPRWSDDTAISAEPWSLRSEVTGWALGTPAYMAPEQFRDPARVDVRADQFAFCVSLYEALWGRRPFAGDDVGALRRNIEAGRLLSPPPTGGVPAQVRAAILKGLAPGPDDRHASMDALLGQLQAGLDARARKARQAWRAAALLGVLAAAGAGAWWRSASQVCRGASARAQAMWGEASREAVRHAFAATGSPAAAAAFTRLDAALRDYAAGWAQAHTATCEATAVRREQSEQLLDLRMACLERRHGEARALAAALSASAPSPDRALEAAAALTPVDTCADAQALLAIVPAPRGAAQWSQWVDVRERLDGAEALVRLGRYAEALEAFGPVVQAARRLGHAPTTAEALLAQGTLHAARREGALAEPLLREAAVLAGQAHDDRLLARAWSRLFEVLTWQPSRRAEAELLIPVMEAAVERSADARLQGERHALLGAWAEPEAAAAHLEKARDLFTRTGDKAQLAGVLATLGQAEHNLGKVQEALAHCEASRVLRAELFGPEHPLVAASLNCVGRTHLIAHRFPEAEAAFRAALAIEEKAYAPDHRRVADTASDLAVVLGQLRRFPEAGALHERALAAAERARGPEHEDTTRYLADYAHFLIVSGEPGRAIEPITRAIALTEKLFPAPERRLAPLLDLLGNAHFYDSRPADALAPLLRAVAINTKLDGPDSLGIASNASTLGWAYGLLGQHAQAVERHGRARAIALEALPPDSPMRVEADANLAGSLLDVGRAAEALPLLEGARKRSTADAHVTPTQRALVASRLGRALWTQGAERARAWQLMEEARAHLDTLQPRDLHPGERREAQLLRALQARERRAGEALMARTRQAAPPGPAAQAADGPP